MTADQEADLLLQQHWKSLGQDDRPGYELRGLVTSTVLSDAVTAGRALPVLLRLKNNEAWVARIRLFQEHVAHLVRRQNQLDQLGHTNTEPEAVFEILGDELGDLDMAAFDPTALRRARIGKATTPEAAVAFLDALGLGAVTAAAENELRLTAQHLMHRASRFPSHAMFHDPRSGLGVVLGVEAIARDDTSEVIEYSRADTEMAQQARAVLHGVFSGGAAWNVEWDAEFGGSSIGLALWVAALTRKRQLPTDPLVAATGRLDATGRVCAVGGITEKMTAAVASGFRRILVPAENRDEARTALDSHSARRDSAGDIVLIPIEHVDEIRSAVARARGGTAIGVDGTLRLARALLPLYGLDLAGEQSLEHGYRLSVADASSRALLDVFSGRNATVKTAGKGSALNALTRLVSERLPRARVEQRSSVTLLVPTEARQAKLRELIERHGADPVPTTNEYETFRYRFIDGGSQAIMVGYTTNKVQVQAGQAPAHDNATNLLAQAVEGLSGANLPSSATNTSPRPSTDADITPHIGTDEAGKGDYFGPLVCAACYLDIGVARVLTDLGVRDSKTLSDKTIARLAEQIRGHLGGRFAVKTIRPARYNSLYADMRREGKNLNSLVAWGHVRAIQDLFGHGVWAEYAVIDKFADERYIADRLARDSRRGRMRLDQRTKAESDIAVAAASILARDAFVRWLDKASAHLGLPLPKGAGPAVIDAARILVTAHGPGALNDYAKTSFKTTQTVLGSPQ